MSRTINYRGYVHHAYRTVMIWNKSLECWVISYINKDDEIHRGRRDLFSFESEKTKAIAKLRSMIEGYGDGHLPQSGWKKVLIPVKGARDWAGLTKIIWDKLQ
jgi:hypothetical protein